MQFHYQYAKKEGRSMRRHLPSCWPHWEYPDVSLELQLPEDLFLGQHIGYVNCVNVASLVASMGARVCPMGYHHHCWEPWCTSQQSILPFLCKMLHKHCTHFFACIICALLLSSVPSSFHIRSTAVSRLANPLTSWLANHIHIPLSSFLK